MARETKAERVARESQERFAQQQQLVETWTARLLALMERAQNVGFKLQVRDAKFVLREHDECEQFEFTLEHSDVNENTLGDLEWRVELKEERLREANRRAELRSNAMSKLTEEEARELGLM